MAQITGVTVERSLAGTPTYIKFNFKQYGGLLQEFFSEKGLDFPIEEVPNATTVKAMKEAEDYRKLKSYSSVESLLEDCLR